MIDPNELELKAIEDGGANGGEYLDSIGKSDLEKLTQHEWHMFIRSVVGGFGDSLRKQEAAVNQQVATDNPNTFARKR